MPHGPFPCKPLSLHTRPTRGLPSWTAVPHLYLSKGKNKASVWQEQDTLGGFTQSPAVSSGRVKLTLSWYPTMWSPRTDGCDDPFIPTFMPCWRPSCFVLRQPMRETVQIFLFKKKIKSSILPNLLQYWMFDFSRTLFPFDLISALGDPSVLLWEKQTFSNSENVSSPQSFCFI